MAHLSIHTLSILKRAHPCKQLSLFGHTCWVRLGLGCGPHIFPREFAPQVKAIGAQGDNDVDRQQFLDDDRQSFGWCLTGII